MNILHGIRLHKARQMNMNGWISIFSQNLSSNIDFDNMKSLGNLSAKAIRKVMLLAVIKAEKRRKPTIIT